MLSIKGRENKIELCFGEISSIDEAIEELKEKGNFLRDAEAEVSYSGIELSYNEEMRFEKSVKELFGDGFSLDKKHRLSKAQIEYSLCNGERILKIVEGSLRSGEVAESRGDLVVYGDVNPGALVKAAGNITVIGALRGTAIVTDESKVFAVYMQPSQIRIGKHCSYNKKTENVGSAVALAENGEIILQCL